MQNISFLKFLFPIFRFFFSFFLLFSSFLFFPFFFPFHFPFLFGFSFFLLFLHSQTQHRRIRGHRIVHARVPVSARIRVGPATNARPRVSLSLSHARRLQRPIRRPRESHARGAEVSSEFGVGPATQTRSQRLSRITRASSAPPNHSRSFPAHAISSPKPNLQPHEFKCKPISSRETQAEPKQKEPITRRHVATAADLKNKSG